MQAYFINVATRTIVPFEFSGKMADLADILHTDADDVKGVGITEGNTPDVLFCADKPHHASPFFIVSGLPVPIKGNAVIIGMNEEARVGDQSGGSAKDPEATLDWVRSNIMWLGVPTPIEEAGGLVGFKPDMPGNSKEAILNVLRSMGQFPEELMVDLAERGEFAPAKPEKPRNNVVDLRPHLLH